ncbi:hypothetical protein PHMEG_00037030 [Phytophthora megakarya]|uniref:Uncharacterized protein n=1 Tax=Phytophthora megakarya TaxID=4795 RepID=A0A225UKR5_9STRA|nr:hypothetical protein PHMEG_00037030 [Phytophthora megakarya]
MRDVSKLTFKPIFRTIYPSVMDTMRNQADIDLENSPAIRVVNDIVVELISDLHPKWSVATQEWHALKSLPGGEIQQLHRDFQTFETAEAILKHSWIQASAFIALEESTELHVVPGCFAGAAVQAKAETIEIQRGQLLIFRGDLPHAGASYEEENTRLHCFIRVDGIDQDTNATEAVVWESNSDKERIDKLRKKNNDKGGKCAKCQRHFSKKNTLVKHKC